MSEEQKLNLLKILDQMKHSRFLLLLQTGKDEEIFCSKQLQSLAAALQARESASSSAPEKNSDMITNEFVPLYACDCVKFISLRDNDQVYNHLYSLLEEIQQVNCKSIAKSWIKELEPNKQSVFPYKNGAQSKPGWWPPNVVHREPDHIKKDERIKLLITIGRTNLSQFSVDPAYPSETTAVRLKKCEVALASSLSHEKLKILSEFYYVVHHEELFRIGKLTSPMLQVSDLDYNVMCPDSHLPNVKRHKSMKESEFANSAEDPFNSALSTGHPITAPATPGPSLNYSSSTYSTPAAHSASVVNSNPVANFTPVAHSTPAAHSTTVYSTPAQSITARSTAYSTPVKFNVSSFDQMPLEYSVPGFDLSNFSFLDSPWDISPESIDDILELSSKDKMVKRESSIWQELKQQYSSKSSDYKRQKC